MGEVRSLVTVWVKEEHGRCASEVLQLVKRFDAETQASLLMLRENTSPFFVEIEHVL